MVDVVARLKAGGKNFEIIVDSDKAIYYKKKKIGSMDNILSIAFVYHDYKKGLKASGSDLKDAFGTEDVNAIAEKILNQGEILLPQEYREKEREAVQKQIIDFIVRNCINPKTNTPYTPEFIANALRQVGTHIDENKGVQEQALALIKELEKITPIRVDKKRLSIKIPAEHTGRVYSFLKQFQEKEEWLSDGSLVVIVNIPSGMQFEFYDKLNSFTKGSAITAELKEKY